MRRLSSEIDATEQGLAPPVPFRSCLSGVFGARGHRTERDKVLVASLG